MGYAASLASRLALAMKAPYLRTIFLMLTLHMPLLAMAEEIGILHLRPLHLVLPPTWQFDGDKTPIEGRGPDGEKLLISILRRKNPSAPPANEIAKDFADTQMTRLGSKGTFSITRPVSQLPAPSGKVVFSVASQSSNSLGNQKYFIQYLLADASAMIYLTVEGGGMAVLATEQFDSFIATQSWDN